MQGGSAAAADEFRVGSLMRIKLRNFMTYSHIDLRCGPSFNLVLGPNGSGKSSLVSAICLGLGGSPQLLSRSPKLSSFVQHGSRKAIIEIELCTEKSSSLSQPSSSSMSTAAPSKQSTIIRRTLHADTEKSSWRMDNEPCSQQQVKDLMENLSIQVENLCTFMPQERVQSFAQMTAKQLLVETMRTVGGVEMVERYDQLIEASASQRLLHNNCTVEEDELRGLVQRNAAIEPEVQRYLDRQNILEKIALLEAKRPWMRYNQARADFMQVKQQRRELNDRLRELEVQNRPLRDQLAAAEAKVKEANSRKSQALESYRRQQTGLRAGAGKLEMAEQRVQQAQADLGEVKEKQQEFRQQIRLAEREVVRLQRELDNRPANDDAEKEDIQERLKAVKIELRQAHERFMVDEDVDEEELMSRRTQLTKDCESLEKTLRAMNDHRERQIQNLSRWNQSVYRTLMFIRENPQLFDAPILGPVGLEVNLKDERYADACEAVMQRLLLTFVAQSEKDYNTLMSHANDKMRLTINAVQYSHLTRDKYRSSYSRDRLKSIGFDGVLSDFFDAPDPIMVAILENTLAHQTPVALGTVNHDAAKQMKILQYFAEGVRYSLKQSEYGARLITTRASKVQSARNLNRNHAEDAGEKDRMLATLQEKRQRLEGLERQLTQLNRNKSEFKSIETRLNDEKDRLMDLKRKIIARESAFRTKEQHLDKQRKRLERMKADPPHSAEAVQRRFAQLCSERAQLVLELTPRYLSTADLMRTQTEATLAAVHDFLSFNRLETELRQKNQATTEAQAAFDNMNTLFDQCKQAAQQLLEEAQRAGELTDEMREKFAELPDSFQELEEMLISERAKAELNIDTDPRVVDQYRARKQQIEEKTRRVRDLQTNLQALRQRMEDIRGRWEPAVIELMRGISERFSIYFSRLNCAGEIRLARDPPDDYDKWGVEILVKFRDSERLAALTAHRQSGGERAVSTIMYLMSLQHFSRAPFCVVDEINQGMDPRNERLVHSQIVQTVCGVGVSVERGSGGENAEKGGSQYFLITPKLLPNLQYHRRMKVIVVNNGEYLPAGDQWQSCHADRWLEMVA